MALNDIPMSSLVSSRCIEINDLPNEVLTKILEMIDVKSELSAAQVCKRWRDVIYTIVANNSELLILGDDFKTSGIMQYEHRLHISVNNCGQYLEKNIRNIMKRLLNLESVVLSLTKTKHTVDVYGSNTYFMTAINLVFQYCDCDLKLIALSLYANESIKNDNNSKLDNIDLLSVCKKFPNVNTFKLFSTQLLLDDQCLSVIVDNWRELEVLSITTNRQCISGGRVLFPKFSANIKQLELPSFMFENGGLKYLVDGKQCFDKLKVLRNVVVNETDSDAIKQIGHRFPSLKKISFHIINSGVISFTLMDSVSKLTNLKDLLLHFHVDYDDDDDQRFDFKSFYKSFRCLKHCKTIKILSIELGKYPHHDYIAAIAEYMPQLLSFCIIIDNIREEWKDNNNSCNCLLPITRMKQLKRLDILNENCCLSYDCFRHLINYLNAQNLAHLLIRVNIEIADNDTRREARRLLRENNLRDDISRVSDKVFLFRLTFIQ